MKYRPCLHFSPNKGWMNDPNGLSFFKGKYHLFFQYNPYSTVWGKMHWGHAISTDLIHWEELPIALVPDEEYENDEQGGCFSGSAIVVNDRLYLMYTATRNGVQSQCIAYSDDGINFIKYDKNPVILPPAGIHDSRDPFLFRVDDKFCALVGFLGKVEIYSSPDLFDWVDEGVFFSLPSSIGSIVECPSIVTIGNSSFLTFSPIDYGRNGNIVTVVHGELKGLHFSPKEIGAIDYGSDFYALQSFQDPKGRRISFAWENGWQWMNHFQGFGPTEAEGWRGFMSFPRALFVKDGHLCSYPVTEVVSAYGSMKEKEVSIGTDALYQEKDSDLFHLSVSIDSREGKKAPIEIGIYKDSEKSLSVILDFHMCIANCIETSSTGQIMRIFSAPLPFNHVELDVFADKAATEIFIQKGWSSFSINSYRKDGFKGPWVRALSGNQNITIGYSWIGED